MEKHSHTNRGTNIILSPCWMIKKKRYNILFNILTLLNLSLQSKFHLCGEDVAFTFFI